MKKLYFLSTYITLFITIAVLFNANNALAQNPVTLPASVSQSGVREIELNAGGGKVKISLPDDMRAGDTISGTVYAEAGGKTETEQAKNSAELRGYVVEIAGSQQSPWETIGKGLRAVIKFSLTEGKTPTGVLKSKAGATISNFTIPVSSIGITTPPTSPPTANDFKLPTIGQQGRPVTITGPFDGNFDNTRVSVGDQSTRLIAESPRKVVFSSPTKAGDQSTQLLVDSMRMAMFPNPANVNGPTQITLNEGNIVKTGTFRNVGVNLTSPKTNLKRGEKTSINVQVTGLQGLTSPVPLQLVTTGGVNMQGGNTQNIQIQPKEVKSDGSFNRGFTVVATQAGVFNVTATVLTDPDAEEQEQAKCKCTCELNNPPILPGRTGKGTYEASVKTAKCEGEDCSVASTTYSWSVVAADSTAEYKVKDGTKNASKFEVEVTKSGTLTVSVTVTVTCSDGTTCSATGTKTFKVKK